MKILENASEVLLAPTPSLNYKQTISTHHPDAAQPTNIFPRTTPTLTTSQQQPTTQLARNTLTTIPSLYSKEKTAKKSIYTAEEQAHSSTEMIYNSTPKTSSFILQQSKANESAPPQNIQKNFWLERYKSATDGPPNQEWSAPPKKDASINKEKMITTPRAAKNNNPFKQGESRSALGDFKPPKMLDQPLLSGKNENAKKSAGRSFSNKSAKLTSWQTQFGWGNNQNDEDQFQISFNKGQKS